MRLSMKKRLNVAIIGAGAVAEIFHIPALQRLPEYKIKYIIDVNEKRLKAISRKFSLSEVKLITDYNEALNDPDVDEVLILTPPHLHKVMLKDSAAAKKHIFCEKPFALNVNEAVEMINICKENDVKLFVGHNFRFIPSYYHLRHLLNKNIIGNVISGQFNFFANAFKWPSVTKFQYKKGEGGALFEMGIHHVDLSNWYFGNPISVNAVISSNSNHGIDDTASVFVKYESGVTSHLNVAWCDVSYNNVFVLGYEGNLYATIDSLDILYRRKKLIAQAPIIMKAPYFQSPYIKEHLIFYNYITKNRDSDIIQHQEIVNSMKVVQAAYESSEKKREIFL